MSDQPGPAYDPELDDLPEEGKGKKSFFTFGGSLAVNLVIWTLLALVTNQVLKQVEKKEVVFDRVQVAEKAKPKTPPPPPKAKDLSKVVQKAKAAAKQPSGPAPRIVTSGPGDATASGDGFAATSGNGPAGVVNNGQLKAVTPKPETPPAPKPDPTPVVPVAPPVTKPDPPKPTPPPPVPVKKPAGVTAEAVATSRPQFEIPESLRTDPLSGFVRIKIDIDPQGNGTVTLDTSCGNRDIDNLAVETVKKWKWQAAKKDGEPVPSVQFVRFNIEIG